MKSKRIQSSSINTQMKRMLLVMSILFAVLCIYINHSMQKVLFSNASEYAKITDEKLENQLEFLYKKMDVFSMSIANEEEVQKMMHVGYGEKTPYVLDVEKMLTYYKVLDPEIVDISLVNEEVHYSTMYSYDDLDALRTMNQEKTFSWIGVRNSSLYNSLQKTPMILYAREIMSDGQNVGTLIISIDISALQMDSTGEMNSYYLLADESEVLYSFNSTEEEALEIWEHWKNGEEKRVSGLSWYVQSSYLENMACYRISALNVQQIRESLGILRMLVWSCVVVAVVFFLLFFWLVKKNIINPLQKFHGVIRRIRSSGQRSLKEELCLGGSMEIQEIGDEFSGMMRDIDQLNRKIFDTATDLYEMKVKKQEAELSYMRSQIDPHFLYNTLEVFRKEALEKNAPELAQMAVDMGNIFRYSTKGDSIVTLGDEISIIKSYVRIQKNRFRGKIEVFYFIPEETMQIPVMKMLLQPMVENAIFHGLEPKEEKGNLYIGARVEEDALILTVKDDGVGIEKQKLAEIQELLEQDLYDTSRHVGILNTQARIRLQYGREYGLQVESDVQDGTSITLRVPAKES